MRFRFISTKTGQYPVAWMCRRLRVSRSGYYAWRNRTPSKKAIRDVYLALRIRAIFKTFSGIYGSPRIYDELVEAGEAVSRKRVIRLMQQEGLCANIPRQFCKTTDSDHDDPIAPNTVDRNFNPDDKNQLWATDISYVKTWLGFVYLAVVIDLYSRRVVGWALANHMRTELTLDALEMAVTLRKPGDGLLHHSDRGCQYTSGEYQAVLKDKGMECSMSRKGNCWDNSCVESFFATIKKELIYRRSWPNIDILNKAIEEYMFFYNGQRRHSTLGSMSPIEYEVLVARENLKVAA